MILRNKSGTVLETRKAPYYWNGLQYVTKNKDVVGLAARYTWTDLPPNCEMCFEGVGEHKINNSWVADSAYQCKGWMTGGISTSQSVSATSYNAGRLKVKVLKHRNYATYKIYATIKSSSGTISKTLTLNAGATGSKATAASVEQTFDLTGLKQDTTYTVTFSIYQIYKSKEYLGASNVSAGSFKTPAMSSYLSVPAVVDVRVAGLSHTARVYWKVTAVKANSYYKLFYLAPDGAVKDTGVQVTSAPISGYTDITIPEAAITETRDVTFFVRAYSTQTAATNYNESNRLSATMYSRFAWTVPKVQGGAAVVTAGEWNRCKEFVGVKVSSFRETDVYNTNILPGETVTNEEIQAVVDALQMNRTIDDGDAITAELYNAIETAINS